MKAEEINGLRHAVGDGGDAPRMEVKPQNIIICRRRRRCPPHACWDRADSGGGCGGGGGGWSGRASEEREEHLFSEGQARLIKAAAARAPSACPRACLPAIKGREEHEWTREGVASGHPQPSPELLGMGASHVPLPGPETRAKSR